MIRIPTREKYIYLKGKYTISSFDFTRTDGDQCNSLYFFLTMTTLIYLRGKMKKKIFKWIFVSLYTIGYLVLLIRGLMNFRDACATLGIGLCIVGLIFSILCFVLTFFGIVSPRKMSTMLYKIGAFFHFLEWGSNAYLYEKDIPSFGCLHLFILTLMFSFSYAFLLLMAI